MSEAKNRRPASKTDERWNPYRERFSTLPDYYFSVLDYPVSVSNAESMIAFINVEMKAIARQFVERQTELECFTGQDLEKVKLEYNTWKVKALRAQRMKEAQIKVLQAWLLDNVCSTEERLTHIEKQMASVKDAILLLARASCAEVQEVVTDLIQ